MFGEILKLKNMIPLKILEGTMTIYSCLMRVRHPKGFCFELFVGCKNLFFLLLYVCCCTDATGVPAIVYRTIRDTVTCIESYAIKTIRHGGNTTFLKGWGNRSGNTESIGSISDFNRPKEPASCTRPCLSGQNDDSVDKNDTKEKISNKCFLQGIKKKKMNTIILLLWYQKHNTCTYFGNYRPENRAVTTSYGVRRTLGTVASYTWAPVTCCKN